MATITLQRDDTGNLVFRQYYLGCLSHASYLVGDRTTGRAVVVDPQRDVSQYLADAAAEGLRIERVIETHFHADFVSGHLELAERAGAVISYGEAAAGRTEFPMEPLADGQKLRLGEIELEALATPGHTPESICVVVRARSGDAVPFGVLTGDTLFIGDVGRPDLLASVGSSAEDLGRALYRSLHTKLLPLPDDTRVYPAHGAGSACGKNLSTATVSTIGEQRRTNYALAPMSEDDFVRVVTEGQSTAPMYFLYAATTNRKARDTFDDTIPEIRTMSIHEVLDAAAHGAAIVDSRQNAEFAAGHLVGSLNVGLDGRFAEYAGEIVRPGTPIVLVCEEGSEIESVTRLARIGFDSVVGVLGTPQQAFLANPSLVRRASRLTADELVRRRAELPALQIVDIRGPGEVANGMIPGAKHVQLPALLARIGELDPSLPTVAVCAGGYRSSIAASTLRANGFGDVSDLLGGMGAWVAAGQPVTVPAAAG